MGKRSTVTERSKPVVEESSVTGPLCVHGETFFVETTERVQVVDLTDRVMAIVREAPVEEGLANVFSTHTTCTLFINEFQSALIADVTTFFEQIVAREANWRHNDPRHSDCDRMNADAHLRALLLSPGMALQVSGGEVVLGQWQRLLLAEFDGPRVRTLRIQLMGTA